MQEFLIKITKWYYSRPFFTRTYLTICIVFTILISLNLISSYHIFYTFEETFFKLHIWRPLTAFLFIQKLDIIFVISLYVLYFSLFRLQKSIKSGAKYAEFLWMIFLLLVCCVAVGTFINVYFLSDIFIIALVYISSRKVSSQKMHIFSGLSLESAYLPYGYIILMFFIGHQWVFFILNYKRQERKMQVRIMCVLQFFQQTIVKNSQEYQGGMIEIDPSL